jgi:hypothetical protein
MIIKLCKVMIGLMLGYQVAKMNRSEIYIYFFL